MRITSLSALGVLLLLAACAGETAEKVTPGGIPYVVHVAGDGPALEGGFYAFANIDMRKQDSVIFSTTDGGGEPQVLPVPPDSIDSRDLDPITDVLRYLSVGDSATITFRIDTIPNLPPELMGEEFIYYDVKIVEGLDEAAFQARQAEKQAEIMARMAEVQAREEEMVAFATANQAAYAAGTLEGVETTESGLSYVIHEAGSGERPQPGQTVSVQYIGMLSENGSIFDQSFNRGQAIQFALGVGQVIPGWDEGIGLLAPGARATLIIPSGMGYGATGTPDGSIPPDSELMFYVELEEVR